MDDKVNTNFQDNQQTGSIPTEVISQPEVSDSKATIVTIIILFIFYPLGILVMWLWPKWNTWVKVLLTTIPIILIAIIVLSLPYLNPNIEKRLEPLQKCIAACNTDNINSPCIKQCQTESLKKLP